jgi:DNA-binding transcriptional MerR regulator
MFKIGDFSRLSMVTVKALRFYDEIGLLKPVR